MRTDSVHSKDLQTDQILQDNSWTESPGLKNLCAICRWMLVQYVKVVFIFSNHQMTLKFTQKVVSFLFFESYMYHLFKMIIHEHKSKIWKTNQA